MARILVTEEIADGGLDRLRAAGHEVDVRFGLSPAELLEAIAGAHALIIRSATMVTDEVLAAGTRPARRRAAPGSASTTSTSRRRRRAA